MTKVWLASVFIGAALLACSGSDTPDATNAPSAPSGGDASATDSSAAQPWTGPTCAKGNCAPGAHGMFVLFPPAPGDAFFTEHVAPALLDPNGAGTTYVKGATIAVPWKAIQPTNAPPKFDGIDALIKPWTDAGKQFALVFQPTSVTETHANANTPDWFITPSNISTISQTGTTITVDVSADTPTTRWAVGSLTSQLVQISGTGTSMDGMYPVTSADATHLTVTATSSATLSAATGTVGNPIYGATGNCKNGTLPVEWDPNFVNVWRAVISAAQAHYASNSSIAYMRFGLGIGGEVFISSSFDNAACHAELVGDGYSDTTWTSYLTGMADFIQASQFRWTIDLALDQNSFQHSMCMTKDCGGYTTTSDPIASYFASKGIAIGTEGIQNDDISNYASGTACFVGNWCKSFDSHPEVPKQFQGRTAPSDPLDVSTMALNQTGVTGSWAQLLPFGLDRGAQIAELFFTDWLCAFDSTWTMGAGDAGLNDTFANCTKAGYPDAIKLGAVRIN